MYVFCIKEREREKKKRERERWISRALEAIKKDKNAINATYCAVMVVVAVYENRFFFQGQTCF